MTHVTWFTVGLVMLCSFTAAVAVAAEPGPWPAEVEGFTPPQPGEHPRLLFRKADVPAMRDRAKTPEGKAMLDRLRVQLNGSDGKSMPSEYQTSATAYEKAREDIPVGAYTLWHGAGYGLLYQVTGEQQYADLGREAVEKAMEGQRDRDDRYAFVDPGGFLRAGPSVGAIALAYDLCYDGWDEAFREKVAVALQDYDGGMTKRDGGGQQTMKRLALDPKFSNQPGSNHFGMQVGGAALAMLAIRGDPGTDTELVEKYLNGIEENTIKNFTRGFGDHGWFAEGDGTGVMSSHIAFLQGLQAWRVAGGKDFTSPRPNCRYPVLKFVLLTIPKDNKPDFPKRGAYPQNVWNRDGMSGPGTFHGGFGIVNEDEKPALLWLYNRVSRQLDQEAGGPFETASVYPQHTVAAFVNWPIGMEEANPKGLIAKYLYDQTYGFFAFRDRWQDHNDILITVQPKPTRGWHKANKEVGDVWVWANGKKDKWGKLRGDVTHFQGHPDGSGTVTVGDTAFAADFSQASGARGMLVMTGEGAPSDDAVKLGDRNFAFRFITDQEQPPEPQARGDHIAVGNQTVRYAQGRIVLGTVSSAD